MVGVRCALFFIDTRLICLSSSMFRTHSGAEGNESGNNVDIFCGDFGALRNYLISVERFVKTRQVIFLGTREHSCLRMLTPWTSLVDLLQRFPMLHMKFSKMETFARNFESCLFLPCAPCVNDVGVSMPFGSSINWGRMVQQQDELLGQGIPRRRSGGCMVHGSPTRRAAHEVELIL